MEKPLIEFINVCKKYVMGSVEVPALCGVSFKINKGELVGIIGASGSGKSTCMHLIGSLDTPTDGKILLNGKDISKYTDDELAKIRGKEIGFVFQTFNLIPSLSALENVELPMIFQQISPEKRRNRAVELLKTVGLTKRIEHLPSEMSGGERQRVAIARALANNPNIVIADEPTGNLDSKTGRDIMELLIALNKNEGKTVIIVTHDLDIAKGLKRLIKLKDGAIVGG